jgi:quinoprotein glucose dehydrogenase
MKNSRNLSLIACLATTALVVSASAWAQPKATDWTVSGGDPGFNRFSPIDQINASNAKDLKPVWVYDAKSFTRNWENTPLLVGGVLIVEIAPSADLAGVDPVTGKELWRRKGAEGKGGDYRGFSYWPGDGKMKGRLVVISGGNMIGVDPSNGKDSADWPKGGFNVIEQRVEGVVTGDDLGAGPAPGASKGGSGASKAAPPPAQAANGRGARPDRGGQATMSPPVIYKNLAIFAGATGFLPVPGQPAGPHAYDLRTGKLVWQARLVSDEKGNWKDPDQVLDGGSWGFLTLDEKTGTVYVPTDSGSPDLVGIWRPGKNQWADSTVALDAMTGKIKWAFQNHYHDIFDQDTMAAPVRVDVKKDGKTVPLVVQTTKQGQVWIINADTGKPEYGYKELPVPKSKVPGEQSWPVQPFPDGLSLAQMHIDRDHLSTLSPASNAECKKVWDDNKFHTAEPWQPPDPGVWTIMTPGGAGGIDWGGLSVNPQTGWAFSNVTNIPTMVNVSQGAEDARGAVKGNNGWRFATGYKRFHDANGRPCSPGPYGELVGINLATGKVGWRVPLGDLSDEYGAGAKKFGAPNIGPSLATGGGLVFLGTTSDNRFHVFDQKNGKELATIKMAASSTAAPLTYVGKDGRQYVVIAAGGPGHAKYRTPESDNFVYHETLVAFALPKPGEKPVDIITPFPKRPGHDGDDLGPTQ